jgi:hypothetical protein
MNKLLLPLALVLSLGFGGVLIRASEQPAPESVDECGGERGESFSGYCQR